MSRSGVRLLVWMVAVAGAFAATGTSARSLDIQQRMAARAAIEEVYQSHRIWPAGNEGSKPALRDVLPDSALRAAVEDDLLKGKALERIWGRSIGAEDLNAEIERMAASTRAPGVLQELFAALGNDPVLVAECLARPLLTDRLIRSAYASDPRYQEEIRTAVEHALQRRPVIADLRRDAEYAEAIWTYGRGAERAERQGGARVISMDEATWRQSLARLHEEFGSGSDWARVHQGVEDLPVGILSSLQEDDERFFVQTVLEKNEARVKVATVAWRKTSFEEWWARTSPGLAGSSADPDAGIAIGAGLESLPAIAANSCTSDTWTPTQTTGAPSGRLFFPAVWTGTEMILWGGYSGTTNMDTNTGGRYNPATNSWLPTSLTNAPLQRDSHSAVWTGAKVVIWGGSNEILAPKDSGGRYDPATNTWLATSTPAAAPTARLEHTAVWSGTRMIVWGGWNGANQTYDTGALYDPVGDGWTATNRTGAPVPRVHHTAIWSGSAMIIWGGEDAADLPQNTGGLFNPGNNTWTAATSLTGAPSMRLNHTAVWTGTRMIVWGGYDGAMKLNTGGIFDPGQNTWTPTSTTGAPAVRNLHVAVWADSVSQMIVWGGENELAQPLTTGGRYNPAADSWSATSNVGAPVRGQWAPAIWTGSEMIVWGGWDLTGQVDLNTGGRYCATACAAPPPGGATTISVAAGPDVVSWTAIAGADTYDLVRGSLGLLGSSGGNFTTSLQACVVNDLAATSFPDATPAPVGNGFYYLVRGASCGGAGTYDEGGGSQVGSRDAEIAASASNCP